MRLRLACRCQDCRAVGGKAAEQIVIDGLRIPGVGGAFHAALAPEADDLEIVIEENVRGGGGFRLGAGERA